VRLALELARRDWRVRVYCLSRVTAPHDETLRQAGIPLRTFGGRGKQLVTRVRGLRRATIEDGIDVAHSFLVGPTVLTAMALGWKRDDPVFVASNRSQNAGRTFWRRALEGWALRRAAQVTVNYEAGIGFTNDFYGVPRSDITVISNGVENFSTVLPTRSAARESLDLPADAPVLLGLFRLSEEKNLDVFCRTVERTFAEIGPGVCLIAGDGPLRQMLEERIAASPWRDAFRLLGPSDQVPTLLAAADAMLLTSSFEGMPNGIMEAMSAGLPVVATNVGGLPDLVEDGSTGFLCPPSDVEALARACATLLGDDGLRRRIGAQARTRMHSEFSIDTMVDKHCTLYSRLIRGR